MTVIIYKFRHLVLPWLELVCGQINGLVTL